MAEQDAVYNQRLAAEEAAYGLKHRLLWNKAANTAESLDALWDIVPMTFPVKHVGGDLLFLSIARFPNRLL